MIAAHYTPVPGLLPGEWEFTTPIGTHGQFGSQDEAQRAAVRTEIVDREFAETSGPIAEVFAAYFFQ